MDNRAGEMEVFVLSAELKSFSAAGRKLRLSPSAVSKLVTRVEDRLGVRLLVRTTRRLELTPEGEVYLERARRILSEIAETERIVAEGSRLVPRGPLRVNASVGFGERYILPLLPEFLSLYPEIQLDLTLTDSVIDVIGERTDVAIRFGPMRDSSLKAQKLLESRLVVIASPEYLARNGTPRHPSELSDHNCLRFNFRRSMDDWPFLADDGKTVEAYPVTGNMLVSNGEILGKLCLHGLGLGRMGRFHVEEDIAAGRLVPVLETYNPGDVEAVHAVFAGHAHLAARIRAFVDFLVEKI
jgi:DNA-binding transcriptional LysR family regulator